MKTKNTKIISIIALLLMVVAMVLYVISDDEEFPPVNNEPGANGPAAAGQEMPADAPAAE